MLWEVDVLSADPANDHAARAVVAGAADLGIAACTSARAVTGWLIEGELSRSDIERVATTLLARVTQIPNSRPPKAPTTTTSMCYDPKPDQCFAALLRYCLPTA